MTGRVCFIFVAAVLSLAFAPAPFPRTSSDRGNGVRVQRLYKELGGLWRADADAPLDFFYLHRGEKSPEAPGADQQAMPWRLSFSFPADPREKYTGKPARIEADGKSLKIFLPPPEKGEERGTRSLQIQKAGDRLHLRVVGGRFEGTYSLAAGRAKS